MSSTEITTIIVAIITTIIGPILVNYFKQKEIEDQKTIVRKLEEELENAKRKGDSSKEDYGIRIEFPTSGTQIGNSTDFHGRYETKPPDDKFVHIFEIDPDSNQYWAKNSLIIFEKDNRWHAKAVHVGAELGKTQKVAVVVMGIAGEILYSYHRKVGERSDIWPSLEKFTPDMFECHSVMLVKSLPK